MPREISEEEFNYLQGRRQVADFVESIYQDPALNREAKALIKKKYPHLQIPDYDLEQKVVNTFAAEKKKRDDEEAEKKKKTDEEKWSTEAKAAKEKFGFTDEGWKEVEQFMVERNIPDYEVAASYKASTRPAASTPTSGGHYWNFDKQDKFKEIIAEPEKWARQELENAARADELRLKQMR